MNKQTDGNIKRCGWCSDDALYQHYHDFEWGQPSFDAAHLFEMLCLEGQQAGLSWITVLKKRACYRAHFFDHCIAHIAAFDDDALQAKCSDAGLIRHIGKLSAIRDNAKAWLALEQQGINMVAWLWQFAHGSPTVNAVPDYRLAPAQTAQSLQMSKTLKKHGFRFVGATTCYAFMQAVGMVNDHEDDCTFKFRSLEPDVVSKCEPSTNHLNL